jgi:hypothetical protein
MTAGRGAAGIFVSGGMPAEGAFRIPGGVNIDGVCGQAVFGDTKVKALPCSGDSRSTAAGGLLNDVMGHDFAPATGIEIAEAIDVMGHDFAPATGIEIAETIGSSSSKVLRVASGTVFIFRRSRETPFFLPTSSLSTSMNVFLTIT